MRRVGVFWRSRTRVQRSILAVALLAVVFSAVWLAVLSRGESYDYENYTDEACQYARGYDTPGEAENDAPDAEKVKARARLDQPGTAELRAYCVALGANRLAHGSMKYAWMAAVLAVLAVALAALAALVAVLQWDSSDEGPGSG